MHEPVCEYLPEYWQATVKFHWCPVVHQESSRQQDKGFFLTGSTDVWRNILADLQNPRFCQKSLPNSILDSYLYTVHDHYSNICIMMKTLSSGYIQYSLWLHEEISFKLITWKSVFIEMLKVTWQVKKFPTLSSYKTQKYTIGLSLNPLHITPNPTDPFSYYLHI